MQWSKLRASVRALICSEFRNRVDFHVTRYHGNRAKSGMITIDGEKILDLSYCRFCRHSDGWFAAAPPGAVPSYYEWKWSLK